MKIYMEVTPDEYEFPIHIADTISELARITGRSKGSIESQLSRQRKGKLEKSIYKEVEIDE